MAFFSGTDDSTLKDEGKETNHFLSLIVNNKGQYVARITRKLHSHVTIQGQLECTTSSFYNSFNNVKRPLTEDKTEHKEINTQKDAVSIEYFDLNIIKESSQYAWDEIDERLASIKSKKASSFRSSSSQFTVVKEPASEGPKQLYFDYMDDDVPYCNYHKASGDIDTKITFSDKNPYGSWRDIVNTKKPEYKLLRTAAIRLLTLSYISDTSKVTPYEAAQNLQSLVDKEFSSKGDLRLDEVIDTMVEYVIASYQDDEFMAHIALHPEDLPRELTELWNGELLDESAITAWYIADTLKGLPKSPTLTKIIDSLTQCYMI